MKKLKTQPINVHRVKMRSQCNASQESVIESLLNGCDIDNSKLGHITQRAIKLVQKIRTNNNPGLMEVFLVEYGLSTDEGIALMCLAEALLRVPDTQTIDELIEDKIAPSSWGTHLGKSSSSLVNASTWGLMLSGKILREPQSDGIADTLHGLIKRFGEPVIRTAVKGAMKEMGHQFVLGRTIKEAVKRGADHKAKGYTYSYDMLGEAALTASDAKLFYASYDDAIVELSKSSKSKDVRDNPGISIKLSALHPRYEVGQKQRVMNELIPLVASLALKAKRAHMGFNIDAEEANRLDLSLDVIEAVLSSPEFEGWDGFGVVVQAYGKRASSVLDWLYELSNKLDRKIMVRLVKGAYWDSEIKQAQIDGVKDFPVFSDKSATDVSYICCAKKLSQMTDRIYPQFATHNAHTVAAILELFDDAQTYEFQKLHGMGDSLFDVVLSQENVRCRIYAPVGAHKDLLAYLVRRLLENGANSSFVNQIVDENVPAELVAFDPFTQYQEMLKADADWIAKPTDLYMPERENSAGWDLTNLDDLAQYENVRSPFAKHKWSVGPMIAKPVSATPVSVTKSKEVYNPAMPSDHLGSVLQADEVDIETALSEAVSWADCSPKKRKKILFKAADLYEKNSGEIFASLCREAGKSALDAVAEIREAVDFLRFYGAKAGEFDTASGANIPRGIISCISPWNFPLAIFTGQISAALAAGNGVIAKPADPTPIIASIGVRLMHEAGVPKNVLQLTPGKGNVVGAKITTDPRISGVCFTGSTGVAHTINVAMATNLKPDALFIAETGGLNAMIVDSTALPEQAVQDIVNSAFQSAGQRCSALRMLYVQEDVAKPFMEMLYGAMDELDVNLPWDFSTDVGPVITKTALDEIENYIDIAKKEGRLLKRLDKPEVGLFAGPAVIRVNDIKDMKKEIFGPVLHIATFKSSGIDQIIEDINGCGYGLTFGLHTRIDGRVEQLTRKLKVGNIYVNRNQIGAVVGSQPFGGEGLSGTGPKAGGPHYVNRFLKTQMVNHKIPKSVCLEFSEVQAELDNLPKVSSKPLMTQILPGPTGESNQLSSYARGVVLCLGPTREDALAQAKIAEGMGCVTLIVAPDTYGDGVVNGFLERSHLRKLNGFDLVALWSDEKDLRKARLALASRSGPIVPLVANKYFADLCLLERHICVDTTAAGGNATLLAGG